MTKREVIRTVLDGEKPPYVPWSFIFTMEPKQQYDPRFFTNTESEIVRKPDMLKVFQIGFSLYERV